MFIEGIRLSPEKHVVPCFFQTSSLLLRLKRPFENLCLRDAICSVVRFQTTWLPLGCTNIIKRNTFTDSLAAGVSGRCSVLSANHHLGTRLRIYCQELLL